MFDGRRINDYETPKVYEMEQDDVIANYIKLKVVGQDSNEIHYLVKISANMGKLKKSYAESVRIPLSTLRFLFDGRRINDEETPKALEIEQDDIIEVYQEQIGGGMDGEGDNIKLGDQFTTQKFAEECIQLLKHRSECKLPFNQFNEAFRSHFGRNCILADYGFKKQVKLFEAIKTTVEISKDLVSGERILKLRNSEKFNSNHMTSIMISNVDVSETSAVISNERQNGPDDVLTSPPNNEETNKKDTMTPKFAQECTEAISTTTVPAPSSSLDGSIGKQLRTSRSSSHFSGQAPSIPASSLVSYQNFQIVPFSIIVSNICHFDEFRWIMN